MFEALQLLSQWLAGYAEVLSGLAVWVALIALGVVCGYALALRAAEVERRQLDVMGRRAAADTWPIPLDPGPEPNGRPLEIRYRTASSECEGAVDWMDDREFSDTLQGNAGSLS